MDLFKGAIGLFKNIADSPDVADPARAAHKRAVPTGYGLLVHGAAHAAHSRWTAPPGTPPILAHVADLLEESRAEGRQRQRRRADRRWLRHTVTALLDPGTAPVDDPWHVGTLAALFLARVDARIVTSKDVRTVRAAVTAVLGRRRLRELREVWQHAHLVDDTDATTMIQLARRWCQILGIDPDQQRTVPAADPGEFPGRLAQALTDFLAVTAGHPSLVRRPHPRPAAHTADRLEAQQPHRAATPRRRRPRRPNPTRPHPEPGVKPSLIPPGRLRTRQAITADAQTAAGQVPTAAPWQQRRQLPPLKPTLHLAILVDLSGSMQSYADEMSSAAWIFAHAARRAQAVTTTVGFGSYTTVLVAPGERPPRVLHMVANQSTVTFPEAARVADQLLDLRHGRTLRMLAVVSDGHLNDIAAGQKIVTTLHRAGCGVLWLRPDGLPGHTFMHATTVTVADPTDAVAHIASAMVTTLERA
ncbi:VWA domain-containing protein [Actinoplanes friuliensis]|uniref:VWA containing CoxE family protein n=1 Tax=Actinoplanes friuliensis DSM 7358 TaxID=1246995 RepID=U5W6J9_9ACTN|nr:VWA domain-containing protein [Actinoplanes friuliensis]AGZ44779.1 VWA containing CoxE family protein [Actinoplanes friuliensis DSM 7358]